MRLISSQAFFFVGSYFICNISTYGLRYYENITTTYVQEMELPHTHYPLMVFQALFPPRSTEYDGICSAKVYEEPIRFFKGDETVGISSFNLWLVYRTAPYRWWEARQWQGEDKERKAAPNYGVHQIEFIYADVFQDIAGAFQELGYHLWGCVRQHLYYLLKSSLRSWRILDGLQLNMMRKMNLLNPIQRAGNAAMAVPRWSLWMALSEALQIKKANTKSNLSLNGFLNFVPL
jgi:hypothetical protein